MLAMLNLISMNSNSQVLCHFSTFHCFNANLFQGRTEINELLVTVKLASECQSPRPCEYRSNWVSRCWLTCLVIPEVPGYGSMCRFSFHRFTIWCYQYRSHETQ